MCQPQSPYFRHTMAKGAWGDSGMCKGNLILRIWLKMETDFHGLPQHEGICMYINPGANSVLVVPVSAPLPVGVGKASENQNKLHQ